MTTQEIVSKLWNLCNVLRKLRHNPVFGRKRERYSERSVRNSWESVT